ADLRGPDRIHRARIDKFAGVPIYVIDVKSGVGIIAIRSQCDVEMPSTGSDKQVCRLSVEIKGQLGTEIKRRTQSGTGSINHVGGDGAVAFRISGEIAILKTNVHKLAGGLGGDREWIGRSLSQAGHGNIGN